jgi:hypothetical protein
MSDQQEAVAPRTLSDEVEASVSAVWARFVGARPVGAEMEHDGNVFRLTVPTGTEQFKAGLAREDDPPADGEPRTVSRYEHAAARAVSKVTRRKVNAMISKHDAKTGIATEVFILEQLPKKY